MTSPAVSSLRDSAPEWTVVPKRSGEGGYRPLLISQHGQISISGAAHLAIGQPEAVVVLTNGRPGALALRPAKLSDPHARKFASNKNSTSRVLSFSSLVTTLGLGGEPRPLEADWSVEDGLLVLQVRERQP